LFKGLSLRTVGSMRSKILYQEEKAMMRKALVLAVGMLLLVVGWAQADDLNLGGNYTSPIYMMLSSNSTSYYDNAAGTAGLGGGSIGPSSLNGNLLPWVYCVQYDVTVTVPGDYSQTAVNNQGLLDGVLTPNAVNIAWLLENDAASAAGNPGLEAGLQAAIWAQTSGNTLTIDSNTMAGSQISGAINAYNADVGALNAAITAGGGSLPSNQNYVSDFDWMTPGSGGTTVYQGLVTVPEPASLLFLGLGLIGLPVVAKRVKRKLNS